MSERLSQAVGTMLTLAKMRVELAGKIAAHAKSVGENPTEVPDLTLFRQTAPTACFLTSVEPSITFFIQGNRRFAAVGRPC